jgi:hypothetical protein
MLFTYSVQLLFPVILGSCTSVFIPSSQHCWAARDRERDRYSTYYRLYTFTKMA